MINKGTENLKKERPEEYQKDPNQKMQKDCMMQKQNFKPCRNSANTAIKCEKQDTIGEEVQF